MFNIVCTVYILYVYMYMCIPTMYVCVHGVHLYVCIFLNVHMCVLCVFINQIFKQIYTV